MSQPILTARRGLSYLVELIDEMIDTKGKNTAANTHNRKGHILSPKGYSVQFYHSIKEISADWEIAAPPDNIFLQKKYLTLLEENPPIGMAFCYLLFYKNNKPVGVSACQIQNFKLENSLKTEEEKTPCFFTSASRFLKNIISSQVDFNTLVCGNVLLTGEHGYYFDPSISDVDKMSLIEEALRYAIKDLKKGGKDVSVTLVKDYYETSREQTKSLLDKRFNEFTIQPTMEMVLPKEWKSFDDYLGAMYSKYRVRVRRAIKKAAIIEKRAFTAADIEANSDRLYELYESVAMGSGFNVMSLSKTYMLGLKQSLGDDFTLTGYYLEDKLVGFYTTILNGEEMEAHFLGFDAEVNRTYQVYLNMLYDMVKKGIDLQVNKIVFARTALEIKSSVGAVAHEMYCYMRHRKSLPNKFFNSIMDYMEPDLDWTPRHPFKPKEEV